MALPGITLQKLHLLGYLCENCRYVELYLDTVPRMTPPLL